MRKALGLKSVALVACVLVASSSLNVVRAASPTILVAQASPGTTTDPQRKPGLVMAEFIYNSAPISSCHASTIAETESGLVAAWFGGNVAKNDIGIWLSRRVDGRWTEPVEVAHAEQSPTKRFRCWNPVLFQPRQGPLMLFYKVGPNAREWTGWLLTSNDGGRTWSAPRQLPGHIFGPSKNKPIQLLNGDILCPASTENEGWRVHIERSTDLGETWEKTGPLNDGVAFASIQPSILRYADGRLQILCRSRQGRITDCWSSDSGKTWSEMRATALPNEGSGNDAVTLADGRQLLVYNHSSTDRTPLNVALSRDGKNWQAALVLENRPGEYSYPAVIQSADGRVHITYTWNRKRIKYAVLDPTQLVVRVMPNGEWPE